MYVLVFMVVALQSCKKEQVKTITIDENNGVEVQIKHSAGDTWDSADNFLPLPFNVASLDEEQVIVLSKRIKRGEKLKVKVLGAVRVLQNDTLITYVITLPLKAKYESLNTVDFDEFSTVYSGAKWIIEQYLINRRNSYSVKLKSWENENFAIKYLLK
jgi:hypothetical protein